DGNHNLSRHLTPIQPKFFFAVQLKFFDGEETRRNQRHYAVPVRPQFCKRLRFHLPRSRLLFNYPEPVIKMQFARTPIIVQTKCRIRLLLRFNDDRPWSERVHSPTRHINHVAGRKLDPVEQLLCAVFLYGFLELCPRRARFQSEADFGIWLRVGYVPALRLTAWFPDRPRIVIIWVNLDGELLVRKKEFCQEREPIVFKRRFAYEFTLVSG